MTFATELAKLPSHATKKDAEGFLPPIARTTGHLLFVLANLALPEGAARVLQDDEILGELEHANEHWGALDHNNALSATADTHVKNFGKALRDAYDEFPNWSAEDRVRNIRDLANRLTSLTVVLDRELVGRTGSDAGYTL